MFTFENNPLKEVSITAWYIVFWFSSHKTEWTNVIPLSGGILWKLDSLSGYLLASKETSCSESWPILVPKDKFFTPWTQSSVAVFIRFTIAINPAELMSSSRIFLLQRGPATRLNVDTMWMTSGILSISTTPNDNLAGWSSRVVAPWISSGNILNISRMKNLCRGMPHTSFKSRYQ